MPTAIIPRYVTGAPYGVRVGMPNMNFPQTSDEARVEVRTNSRGIRSDREYAYEKPLGVCRIVLLGDSLFVGFEVNLQDSFAYLLDKKLEASGHQCEVINLAVSGFGTAEMLVALENEGFKYHPDIVVFSSHATDLDDNLRASLYVLDEADQLIRRNVNFLPGIEFSDFLSRFSLYRWVVENSQLYSAVRERAAYYAKSMLIKSSRQVGSKESPAAQSASAESGVLMSTPYAYRLNLLLLKEAKRLTEAHQAHFSVLEIPSNVSRTQFERRLPVYDQKTIDDLHIYSPLEAFKSAADSDCKIFYEKAHGHLSPFGNQLLADYFFARLLETGWITK